MAENGMINALMEEYRRSAIDLKHILSTVSNTQFSEIRDHTTNDQDCKSIQSVVQHMVQSGYTYINYVNTISSIPWKEYEKGIIDPQQGISEIDNMLDYTETSFQKILHFENKEIETWKFESRWNVTYDFEQLIEHAIVHILRHRRQIENFLNK